MSYFSGEWNSRKPHRAHREAFTSLGDPICLFDLGAGWGTPPPFCWILEGLTLINFEPDRDAALEGSGRNCTIALGPPHLKTLYVNRRPTTSSLLRPCAEVVNRYDFSRMFPEQPKIFDTVSEEQVETAGLDEVVQRLALPLPDFLKIDVQGLTYEVLETGVNTLAASVLGLQVEVEFIETYAGQKTFGSVHEFLEQRDFEIFRLTNLNRWPHQTTLPLKMTTGQDVFCDLLYLRSLRHVERHPEFWSPRRITQFVRICLLYDLTDTAAAYLEKFIAKQLIDEQPARELAAVIGGWTGALDYFYHASPPPGRRRPLRDAAALLCRALLPERVCSRLGSWSRGAAGGR